MLKEQLEELRKTRKTLLHTRKSMIRFVEDEDLDTSTLFKSLPFETPFTKPSSLSFDRHQLSEREETRFNKKFAPFLKQLLPRMKDKSINLMLEYLLRIYSIDTFNPNELLFLLLPFKRYSAQFLALSRNSKSQFSNMKTYSVLGISKILLRDRYLFLLYVEYFRSYLFLREFLDKSLEEIIEMVKGSDLDYLSEFYQIMTYLVDQNEHGKALEIYHRMRSYLESEDFVSLLRPFYSECTIRMENLDSGPKHPFEAVHRNAAGRALLKDPVEVAKYINYLELSGVTPKEFNENEYKMLRILFLGKSHRISNYSDLVALYREIVPKAEFTKYLMKEGKILSFYPYLDDESKVLVVHESVDDPHIDLLTPSNHVSFIKNMRNELFERHYSEILEKCLGFKTFDPGLFRDEKPRDWKVSDSDVVRTNLIKLARHHGHDLTEEFMKMDVTEKLVLSYLLHSSYPYGPEFSQLLISTAKSSGDPTLISDLASFLCRHPSNLNEFCAWACANGFAPSIEDVMAMHGGSIDSNIHYTFFVMTGSAASLRVLFDRKYDFIWKLYESKNFDRILKISNLYGADKVLIGHPAVFDFIASFSDSISDKDALVGYLLDNCNHQASLDHLVAFLDMLIRFRQHKSWEVARTILLEGLSERHQFQSVLDYIIAHFDKFSGEDAALFDRVFESDAMFDCHDFRSIVSNEEAASFFIDSYIRHRNEDILPVIPVVAPILIRFKKESITALFEKYTNIMGAYSGSILREYPEASNVLLHVDARYTLKEICSPFDDIHTPLLLKILGTKKVHSPDVIGRLATAFSEGLGTYTRCTHIVALLRFYERSFGRFSNSSISSLLRSIYRLDKTMFYGIAHEAIDVHSFLFTDVVLDMVSDIISSSPVCDESLLLLSKFLDHHGCFDMHDAFELYKRVFKLKSKLSPALIRSLCQNDFSIGKEVLRHIAKMLQNRSEVLYCLDILVSIFKHVKEARSLGSEIIEDVIVYTEDRDESILSRSSELLELLST